MWGHARVIESNHPEVAVDERVYGYLPMATHLDVVPGKVSAAGFTDMAEHRQPMSPVYNSYTRLAADPEHDPAREGERMIFGPLFKTGLLDRIFHALGKLVRRATGNPHQRLVQDRDGPGERRQAPIARHPSYRAHLGGQCRVRRGQRAV